MDEKLKVRNVAKIGAFAEPAVAQREMTVKYDQPEVDKVRLLGNPIKTSGMEGTISQPAPRVGGHTDEVLGDHLGLSGEQVSELCAKGAVIMIGNEPLSRSRRFFRRIVLGAEEFCRHCIIYGLQEFFMLPAINPVIDFIRIISK